MGACWREGAAEIVTAEFKTSILWAIKAKRKKHTLRAIGAIPEDQETWISKVG